MFVALQRTREIKAATGSAKCAPIAAEILLEAARRTPFVGIAVP